MKRADPSPVLQIERLYTERGDDISFRDVLNAIDGEVDDELLAEVIEADGRRRVLRGFGVTLDRYHEEIDDLQARSDPLDAAIDVTLRSLSGSSRIDASSVESLIHAHPDLAVAIREAAAITNALWSTNGLRESLHVRPLLETPCEFGPTLDDGQSRYELKRPLGQGSAGQVYLANDRKLTDQAHEALVAVKILTHTRTSSIDRFRQSDEATRARRINHPNVVRVLDRGATDDDQEYVVYEFIDGGDLAEWLADHPPPRPPAESAQMIATIAGGVQAAHSARLVHCDLKPGNIIMTLSGAPKVADFGIAAEREPTEPDHTELRDTPLGNIAFISPEQFRTEPGAMTPQSDIYALGGILYQMLTGRLPNGASRTEIEITHHPERGRTTPPAFDPADCIDRDLIRICDHALAPLPEQRYATAAALADDLERWLHFVPLPWTQPGLMHRARLWTRRNRGLAITLVFLSVAVLSAIGLGSYAMIMKVNELERRDHAEQLIPSVLFATSHRESVSQEFFQLWIMRYLTQRGVFGAKEDDLLIWKTQIDTLQKYLTTAEADGRGLDVDVQSGKLALAGWFVSAHQSGEAREIVNALKKTLPQVVTRPEDRIHTMLAATEKCVRVLELLDRVHSELDRTELQQIAKDLRAMAEMIGREDLASGFQFLMLDTLAVIYSQDLLNDPHEQAAVEAERDLLGSYNPLFPHVYEKARKNSSPTPDAGNE